jgi:autotransporter-associated beta strand protein
MIQKRTSKREDRRVWYGIRRFLTVIPIIVCAGTLKAGSATWNLNPVDNNWNNAANWTPMSIPNGENDVASFGKSSVTGVNLGLTQTGDAGYYLAEAVFGPGASAYTITMTPVHGETSYLDFDDAGITNNSGITQNFVAAESESIVELTESARIYFHNSSTAGQNVVITNQASEPGVPYGAFTSFEDSSTAASATIVNEGAAASGTMWGGFTDLLFYSNAEAATFINNPGGASGAAAGHTLLQIYAPGSIGNSTFINNAATVAGAEGGWTEIDGTISDGASFIANGGTTADAQGGQVYTYGGDGYSTFTAEGGSGSNAQGGLIDVWYVPASSQTIVTANGGTNGGLGGTILLEGAPIISSPQFQVFGNGTLDLTNTTGDVGIGSLSGSGVVLLDGHNLSVGINNLSTRFSGVIQESGVLIKVGSGTLSLTGANTYIGATTVSEGTLIASNRSGSATGTGRITVNSGSLGGKGIISGAVTIGTGTGTGAFLAPSIGSNQPAILTFKKTITFKADSTYTCKINTNNNRTDQVKAKGVMIESGAQFSFQAVANKKLTNGTVFTAINNTSANPIGGTFANLTDGSIFTAGLNNFQVSYEGGTGNDLTLTVVP